jgi:hypothetical protein
MAGDDEFGGGGAPFPARNPVIWRRLRPPRVNSFDGEVVGGEADLLSFSEEQGGVRNGGARRRAPITISFHGREGG